MRGAIHNPARSVMPWHSSSQCDSATKCQKRLESSLKTHPRTPNLSTRTRTTARIWTIRKRPVQAVSTSSSFRQSIALRSMSKTQLCLVCSALLLVKFLSNQLTYNAIELHKGQRVTLANLGLKCAGPALGTKYFIDEPCPHQVTLDLDTARLFWKSRQDKGQTPHITLDCRCVACHGIIRIRWHLQRYDVEH